ncbi:MAG: ABC transporter ATP-binding protein [Gammaproteobacteria bacterium]|nr:ABC transporter ATP-binding protein [Gammaproteobacteria bacterium]
MKSPIAHALPPATLLALARRVLAPERAYFSVTVTYTVAISLLTLALPISIQMLIDSVANTALPRAVATLAIVLFLGLFISGLLYALRAYAVELFNRRIFTRISGEIAMSALAGQSESFDPQARLSLFNRYFDILTLKKSIPYVLTSGFTLLLQSLIGFVVVSLYHSYFLVFTLLMVLALALVWRIWGWAAVHSSCELSQAKYDVAEWLQQLAIHHRYFRASARCRRALATTDAIIHHHVDCQERHFRHTYRQLLCLLLLYALASAVMLGIGGWLVIRGELTLGQLVAAELIMSAIFAGLQPLAGYLAQIYDVFAAVEELSRIAAIPAESTARHSHDDTAPCGSELVVVDARCTANRTACRFDITLPARACVRAEADNYAVESAFRDLLTASLRPTAGTLMLAGIDLYRVDPQIVREWVVVLDGEPPPPSLALIDLLDTEQTPASSANVHEALRLMELHTVIADLDAGLQTTVADASHCLTLEQRLRLQLAGALISRPQMVLVDRLFDLVDPAIMATALGRMVEAGATVIYFTAHPAMNGFSHRLTLTATAQTLQTYGGAA